MTDPDPDTPQREGKVGEVALAAVAGPGWDTGRAPLIADQADPSTVPAPDGSALPEPPADWRPFADWLASGAGDLVTSAVAPVGSGSPSAGADASPMASPVPEATPRPRNEGGATRVDGIDVSHWNGQVRYDLVDAASGRFVLMKATQGTGIVDPAFRSHLAGARDAGLLVGAYHFYDYRSDGTAQADHFIDTLDAAGALSDTLPPVVDIECFEPFGSADQAYVRHQLRAFADRVFQRTGRLPMVYTSGMMWRAVTGGVGGFGDLPLWIACWRCESPGLPAGWHDWLFWQTGSTVLDSTGERLGSDRFAGDADELRALATDFQVGAGRHATTDRDVRVPLRLLDGDEARLSLDRVAWTDWLPTRGAITMRLPDRDGRYRVWVRTRTADGVRGALRADAIVLDREAPAIDDPVASVATADPPTDDGPLTVDVVTTVRDGTSGIARVTAETDCGEGWATAEPAVRYRHGDTIADVRVSVSVSTAMTCQVRIRAVDEAGNASRITTDAFPAPTPATDGPTSPVPDTIP